MEKPIGLFLVLLFTALPSLVEAPPVIPLVPIAILLLLIRIVLALLRLLLTLRVIPGFIIITILIRLVLLLLRGFVLPLDILGLLNIIRQIVELVEAARIGDFDFRDKAHSEKSDTIQIIQDHQILDECDSSPNMNPNQVYTDMGNFLRRIDKIYKDRDRFEAFELPQVQINKFFHTLDKF